MALTREGLVAFCGVIGTDKFAELKTFVQEKTLPILIKIANGKNDAKTEEALQSGGRVAVKLIIKSVKKQYAALIEQSQSSPAAIVFITALNNCSEEANESLKQIYEQFREVAVKVITEKTITAHHHENAMCLFAPPSTITLSDSELASVPSTALVQKSLLPAAPPKTDEKINSMLVNHLASLYELTHLRDLVHVPALAASISPLIKFMEELIKSFAKKELQPQGILALQQIVMWCKAEAHVPLLIEHKIIAENDHSLLRALQQLAIIRPLDAAEDYNALAKNLAALAASQSLSIEDTIIELAQEIGKQTRPEARGSTRTTATAITSGFREFKSSGGAQITGNAYANSMNSDWFGEGGGPADFLAPMVINPFRLPAGKKFKLARKWAEEAVKTFYFNHTLLTRMGIGVDEQGIIEQEISQKEYQILYTLNALTTHSRDTLRLDELSRDELITVSSPLLTRTLGFAIANNIITQAQYKTLRQASEKILEEAKAQENLVAERRNQNRFEQITLALAECVQSISDNQIKPAEDYFKKHPNVDHSCFNQIVDYCARYPHPLITQASPAVKLRMEALQSGTAGPLHTPFPDEWKPEETSSAATIKKEQDNAKAALALIKARAAAAKEAAAKKKAAGAAVSTPAISGKAAAKK